MQAEEIQKGIFMLVAFTMDEFNKANDYISSVKELKLSYDIETILIDGTTNKPSASKL